MAVIANEHLLLLCSLSVFNLHSSALSADTAPKSGYGSKKLRKADTAVT